MITDILYEIFNVMFTMFSALIIGWVFLRLFNYRLFENFRMTDDEDETTR
mgnify:CR=1 FL=1